MEARRLLAVAAATRGVGYVFLIEGQLVEWGVSRKAWESPVHAAETLQQWINDYEPTMIVTEKISTDSKKGKKARRLTATLAAIASHNYAYDVSVPINRRGKNRFAYAVALTDIYPDVKPRLPRSHAWYDPAPRNLLIFDALAMAHAILTDPIITIAANLDGSS